jgi:hypothetical protein
MGRRWHNTEGEENKRRRGGASLKLEGERKEDGRVKKLGLFTFGPNLNYLII